MITMTNEQLEKLDLLDKFFGAISVEDLKEIVECEQVVAKLKGTEQNPQILRRLVQEHDMMYVDIMNAKTEVMVLKNDFQTLLRALNQTLFTPQYNNDFTTLKNKHSVY
jgi:hypothetical protein